MMDCGKSEGIYKLEGVNYTFECFSGDRYQRPQAFFLEQRLGKRRKRARLLPSSPSLC
jgi:hypothetical protein